METNMELWAVRFAAILFGAFGLIALLLAVIGVYGVRAFMVARRTREIGIRVALGAQPRHLLAVLTIQGAVHIGIGLTVGLILSLATGRLLASMLLRVSPNDPLSLAAAALPLAAAALLATWLPARRAVRTDPMMTLRHD
jgi:ABC-type antimicrobial peptide transport system permease subunit